LLFDTRFIEIRHMETGHLVQIIPGNDIRCVWDGRIDSGAVDDSTEVHDLNIVQEPRIHAVVNVPELSTLSRRPGRCCIQHVFELLPTIPLYLPGSLASPSSTNYFVRPFSPRSSIIRP